MPDIYVSGGSSKSATRAQLDAEKRDMHPLLVWAATSGQATVQALADLASERVYTDERSKALAHAEEICGSLIDAINDLVGPVMKRADDAGFDPDEYDFEITELEALYAKLKGETSKRAA